MKQRWLVVAIGLPLLLLVLLACPAWATMLLVCAIAGIAAYELLHTAGENVPANFYWGLVTTVVMQEIWLYICLRSQRPRRMRCFCITASGHFLARSRP